MRRIAAATAAVLLVLFGTLTASAQDCTLEVCTYVPILRVSEPQPTATATNTAVPATPTTTIQPSPTTAPPATVRVVSSRTYLSSGDYRYVVGEVINGRSTAVYSVRISAAFYDASNTLVATEYGYALLSLVQPGQKMPFRILLSNAPATITHYELVVDWQTNGILEYRPATILSQQTRDNFGVEVFGTLRNDQAQPLDNINVAVTFYDAAGNVLDVDSGYLGGSELAPGASALYKVTTFNDDLPFVTYLVQAQGYFPVQ